MQQSSSPSRTEAGNTDEALVALGASTLSIDVILCDVAAIGTRSGFELAVWVRQNLPSLEVRLCRSSLPSAVVIPGTKTADQSVLGSARLLRLSVR